MFFVFAHDVGVGIFAEHVALFLIAGDFLGGHILRGDIAGFHEGARQLRRKVRVALSDFAALIGQTSAKETETPIADMLKQIVKFGPPGKEAMGAAQARQRWQSGTDVMSIWWLDMAKSTAQLQGPDLTDDQGADIVPGWKQADGTVRHRAISAGCRTASIPKNAPQTVKDAAFYFIYRMSHPQVSDHIVADPYCGSKPFGAS